MPDDTIVTPSSHVDAESRILEGTRLFLSLLAFLVTLLLSAIDSTIISTALPEIASAFDALDQSAWVVSSYILTEACGMLIFGSALSIVPSKPVYLGCAVVFAVGSLICAVAKSFITLVVGRALAGWGGGGLIVSAVVITSEITRLRDRSLYYGLLGAIVYAVASIGGPLVGGALTERLSWRWCFYLNLPLCGAIVVIVWVVLPYYPPRNSQYSDLKFWQKCSHLDWVGGILCIGCILSLLLALQWGGITRPWSSPTIIALFCVFGVLLLIFLGWEWKQRDKAILPLRVLGRRSQLGSSLAAIFTGICLVDGNFFLPLWYQAGGSSPFQSGVDALPFLLSIALTTIISGALVKIIGRYWHIIVFGPIISSVGAGLLSSIQPDTSSSRIIGYQILYGIGIGCTFQNVLVAVQAEWRDDVEVIAQATTLIAFCQTFGAILGISIAETVFTNQLKRNLAISVPNLPVTVMTALQQSVAGLGELDPSIRESVLRAYLHSIAQSFLLGVPASALASLCAMTVRNHYLKESILHQQSSLDAPLSTRELIA